MLQCFLSWLTELEPVFNLLTAIGTVSASIIAVYFGAIQPMRRQAKFKVHSPTKSLAHSFHHPSNYGKEGDLLHIGFFIEQVSGSPSKNVNVLVKRVWYIDQESGSKKIWNHFVPSNLKWAASGDSFAAGVPRYCHLGIYGNPPGNDFVGNVFDLMTTENNGDPIYDAFSAMLPDSKDYELDLVISGENVSVLNFKIILKVLNQQMIGPLDSDGNPEGGNFIDSVRLTII